MAESLYADNDFDYTVPIYDIDETTGHRVPVTTGAVAGWLAAALTEADAAADAAATAITATVTHVGVDPIVDADVDKPLGTWLVHIDRGDATRAILDPLYFDPPKPTPKPYLVIDDPAGTRVVLPLKYLRFRAAQVA